MEDIGQMMGKPLNTYEKWWGYHWKNRNRWENPLFLERIGKPWIFVKKTMGKPYIVKHESFTKQWKHIKTEFSGPRDFSANTRGERAEVKNLDQTAWDKDWGRWSLLGISSYSTRFIWGDLTTICNRLLGGDSMNQTTGHGKGELDIHFLTYWWPNPHR